MGKRIKLSTVLQSSTAVDICKNVSDMVEALGTYSTAVADISTGRLVTVADMAHMYLLIGSCDNKAWNEIEAIYAAGGIVMKSEGKRDDLAWVTRVRPVAKWVAKKFKAEFQLLTRQGVIDALKAKGYTSFAKIEKASKKAPRCLTVTEQIAADAMADIVTKLVGIEDAESISAQCEQIVRSRADALAKRKATEQTGAADLAKKIGTVAAKVSKAA